MDYGTSQKNVISLLKNCCVLQAPGSDDPAKHLGYEEPTRDSQRQREHLRIHAGNKVGKM